MQIEQFDTGLKTKTNVKNIVLGLRSYFLASTPCRMFQETNLLTKAVKHP